ncbi:MAG: BatA domain-containing protein [Phycisphaerales bacterium]
MNPILAAVGLASVALPILIHILLRRRRQPMAWGAMKFLLEAYRRQRRRMRFEQLLLLAARCLLVAVLALAVGRPLLGASGVLGAQASRTVYLLVDNSIAGDAASSAGERALEAHKRRASDVLKTLSPARGDRVGIVTLAGPAQGVVFPATSDLAAAGELLQGIEQQDSRADLRGAMELIAESQGREDLRPEVVVLSEFRAGSLDVRTNPPVMTGLREAKVTLSPAAQESIANVSVRGVELLQPLVMSGQSGGAAPLPVRVSLSRSGLGSDSAGSTLATVVLSRVGGEELSRTTVDVAWTAGQDQAGALGLIPCPAREALGGAESFLVTARVPADGITRDDAATAPVRARSRLDVFILAQASARRGEGRIDSYGPAEWLSLSLAPQAEESDRRRLDADIRVTLLDPTVEPQLAALSEADAVIVPRPDLLDGAAWSRVADAIAAGAFVMVSPPPDATVHVWADGLLNAAKLKWTIARESVSHDPALTISPQRSVTEGADPLALLAGELDELTKPVRISRTLTLSGGRGAFDSVLTLSDGSVLLATARPEGPDGEKGAGVVAYLACALDLAWSDLPTKPLMLPLMQELIRQGIGSGAAAGSSLAGQRPPLPRGCVELVETGGSPRARSISAGAQGGEVSVRAAGVFAARGASGETIGYIAVNPDWTGASAEPVASGAVSAWFSLAGLTTSELGAPGQALAGGPGGDGESRELPVSLPLLVCAALLGVSEMLMARAFSHAGVAKAG